jgi:hypothetical protein
MIEIIFTFIIMFLVLSVCWFVPKAGTPSFKGPTRKEFIIIAGIAAIPTILVGLIV